VQRLERAVQEWRDEPMKKVALRARLQRPYRLRQFHSFGRDAIVHRPAWVYGPRQIAIGDGVIVLTGSWLSVERSAWDRPAPVLRIGNRVGIRAWCTLSAAESVVIEDDVVLASGVTVIDSSHTWRTGHPNVLYNPLESAPVRIGAGTWIGERAVVLAGARVGSGCLIGANSVVTGEIPDHSVAVGAPARVVGTTEHLRPPGAG
jgi:acetyltransferase-like isoleucine patch superfamily enzyme